VSYVTRIRLFYEILRRIDEQEQVSPTDRPPVIDVQPPAL
jgi:hypothetical protein